MLVETKTNFDQTIIIYRTSSIGDVILSTACLDFLEKTPQPLSVVWIGREPTLSVIQKAYPAVKTIDANTIDKFFLKSAEVIGSNKPPVIVDLQNNWRSRRILKKFQKKFSCDLVAFKKDRIARGVVLLKARLRGRLCASPENNSKAKTFQYKRMVETLRHALTSVGIVSQMESTPNLPSPQISPNISPWQKELSLNEIWLAVAPGAAHPTKRCPVEMISLILSKLKLLPTEKKIGLLILGDEKDRISGSDLGDRLRWMGPFMNLAGKLSLWESALALRHAKVLLTNDSALLHVSEAVNTPVAALFGPTAEIFGFAPWHPQSQTFSSLIGCRPCSKHGEVPCRYGDKLCFASISPDAVAHFLGEKCR